MNELKRQTVNLHCSAPHAVQICVADGCRCVPTWNSPLPLTCEPPLTPWCNQVECLCLAPQPITLQADPMMPADSCAVMAAVIVAGVKKALVSCWGWVNQ
jgi:hypothetical protein